MNQPKRTKFALRVMRNQIIFASIKGIYNERRVQIGLHGFAGTGKSVSAKEFAECFGAPVIELFLDVISNTDLQGRSVSETRFVEIPGLEDAIHVQGRIIDRVRSCGIVNPFVIVGEFHASYLHREPIMERIWRDFFDRDRPIGSISGLEQLKHPVMFVMTNDEPKRFTPAMRSRFVWIRKDPLDEETLREVFRGTLQGAVEQVKKAMSGHDVPVVKPTERAEPCKMDQTLALLAIEAARAESDKYRDAMVKENKDPGARSIQHLAEFLMGHLFGEKLLAGDPNHAVSPEEIGELRDMIVQRED